MKTNAPEKIYACFGIFGLIQATEIRVTSKDVEYTRTDAFIERACEFFENHLCCYIKAQNFTIEHSRLEQDFKNYMKGE